MNNTIVKTETDFKVKSTIKTPCANCGTTAWGAKNDMFCVECEHEFMRAVSGSATHFSKMGRKYYKITDGYYAHVLVNNGWIESEVTNQQLKHNSMFKEL